MTTTETTKDELLIVKMGTDTVTNGDGKLDQVVLAQIVEEVEELSRRMRVVLVVSGAVGAGIGLVPAEARERVRGLRQALSTLGQAKLIAKLQDLFDEHEIFCAQGLSEEHDYATEGHVENMRKTFRDLWRIQEEIGKRIVLVLNANDYVTFEAFPTDNDRLTALAVQALEAERKRAVFLTLTRGLLEDPEDPNTLIRTVRVGTDDWQRYVTGEKSPHGFGGMHSKCTAAEEIALAGIPAYIGAGKVRGAIHSVLSREDGTFFRPPGYTGER